MFLNKYYYKYSIVFEKQFFSLFNPDFLEKVRCSFDVEGLFCLNVLCHLGEMNRCQ